MNENKMASRFNQNTQEQGVANVPAFVTYAEGNRAVEADDQLFCGAAKQAVN